MRGDTKVNFSPHGSHCLHNGQVLHADCPCRLWIAHADYGSSVPVTDHPSHLQIVRAAYGLLVLFTDCMCYL